MNMYKYVAVWIMFVPSIVIGTVSISFEPEKVPLTESVNITCILSDSTSAAVTWNFGSTITSCSGSACAPDPSPHTISINGNVFKLMLPTATVGNCESYTCKDALNVADTISEDLKVAYFDKADIVPNEPGANTDGTISVTTGCVLSPSDLTIVWYKIESGKNEEVFTAVRPSPIDTSDRSTCTRTCHSEEDKKVTNGFNHIEYTGDGSSVEVQYKVTVTHNSYPDASDQYTWTSATYKLEAECTCDCNCKKKCRRIVIPSIIFGSFGAIILPVVIGGTVTEHFGQKTALVVDFIGFVCDVISLGLGIGVQVEDCCEGAEDCCEDSDCCEDECEKNWIETTAIVFIIIGCLVGIVAVVIFYLVWSGRIGRGNNGITKKDLRPSKETVCEKLLRVLESAYPRILLVKDLIRKVDAEESVVMEQLEELKRKDLIRQLDSGGFVRHFLDVKTGITKQDLRPLEEIVCDKLLHVLESVHPNILSVKDLIRIDFAVESVVMEQLEELRRKDLIRQLDSGGFVRHFLDVQTAYKAEEAKEPGENDRMMETSN